MDREERDAIFDLERLLGLERLQGPREQRTGHGRPGRALHLGDVLHDFVGEAGRAGDLFGCRHVGERLDPVAPVDRQVLERRALGGLGGAQLPKLLDQAASDVWALLEHRRLDARDHSLGEAPHSLLVLLEQRRRLALDRNDRRHPEADDQDRHDQQGDLDREPRPEHRSLAADRRVHVQQRQDLLPSVRGHHEHRPVDAGAGELIDGGPVGLVGVLGHPHRLKPTLLQGPGELVWRDRVVGREHRDAEVHGLPLAVRAGIIGPV